MREFSCFTLGMNSGATEVKMSKTSRPNTAGMQTGMKSSQVNRVVRKSSLVIPMIVKRAAEARLPVKERRGRRDAMLMAAKNCPGVHRI